MQNTSIIEVDEQNIQHIIGQSASRPVLFCFWSSSNIESQQLMLTVEKIATEYAGKFILAKLNCDQHPMLAAQFGLNVLPTLYLFENGQPVNGLQGNQSEETIKQLLQPFLPDENEMQFNQAKELMEKGEYDKAVLLLTQLYPDWKQENGECRMDVAFLLINALLKQKQIEEAEKILATIPHGSRDAEYQGLHDHIELLKQAANSPEIQQLQKKFHTSPENPELILQLATKLYHVGRHEEALAILFKPLEKNIDIAEGKIKETLKEFLVELGTANSLATHYRRKLYSLLH